MMSTWIPQPALDITVSADDEATILRRGDGEGLLYSGRVNSLIGASESGKSWLAVEALRQVVTDGGLAVYLDFEDSLPSIVRRLRTVGLADADLARVRVGSPDDPPAGEDANRIASGAQLVVFDGMDSALHLAGCDPNSAADVSGFYDGVLRPIAHTGAAVIAVDHVRKRRDTGERGAGGSQAKRAKVDGASLRITMTETVAPGRTGRLELHVDKDRPGRVRGLTTAGDLVAFATVVSDRVTHNMSIQLDSQLSGRRRDLVDQVGLCITQRASEHLTQADVRRLVPRRREDVDTALAELVELGYAAFSPAPRGGRFITVLKPYDPEAMTWNQY